MSIMWKNIFVVFAVVALAGCGSDHNGGAGGGDGKTPPAGGAAAGDFAQFLMNTKADCAGFRRSYTYLSGAAFSANTEVRLRLNLENGGEYRARITGNSGGTRVIAGKWWVEGRQLRLGNFATGTRMERMNGERLVRLRIDSASGDIAAGTEFPMRAEAEKNDSRMTECSPSDNPAIQVSGGNYLIAGKPAAQFWAEKLFTNTSEGRREASIGRYGAGAAERRVVLRVFENGTFDLEESQGFQPTGHASGTWELREGLIVLGDWGVLTPAAERRTGVQIPFIYLSRDLESGAKRASGFFGIYLPSRGL